MRIERIEKSKHKQERVLELILLSFTIFVLELIEIFLLVMVPLL